MLFYLSAVSFDNISMVDYLLIVFASLILSVTCIRSFSHFGHRDFPALAELYTTSYEVVLRVTFVCQYLVCTIKSLICLSWVFVC